jgi:hypothetical protein
VTRLLAAVTCCLVLGSCATEPVELQGIDFPPASTPESLPQVTWAVPFVAAFPAGHWSEGKHSYSIELKCPPLATEVATPALTFDVSRFVTLLDVPLYLRLGGLSTSATGAIDAGVMHPDQVTQAIVTVLGVTREAADQAVAECSGSLLADGGDPVPMVPGTLYRP